MSTYYPTIVVPAKAGNHKSSQKTTQLADDLYEKWGNYQSKAKNVIESAMLQ